MQLTTNSTSTSTALNPIPHGEFSEISSNQGIQLSLYKVIDAMAPT